MAKVMDIRDALKQFKDEFDLELVKYMDKRIEDARDRDVFTADGLSQCKNMLMSGGKRLRPALTYWSYKGMGGVDEKAIMYATMSVELVHMFLLIHDDIMDRDSQRHGVSTLHEHYRRQLSTMLSDEDAIHGGEGIAIVLGDMMNALGNHTLFSSGFDRDLIFEALTHMQETVSFTVMGQLKDVMLEYRKTANVDDVLSMYEYKTARYTVESPLLLGMILSGKNSKALREGIHDFSIPIGIAFQIRDDILGLYGDEDTIGKPVGSDIQEGKMTLLVVLARDMASSSDRKIIDKLLGTKIISKDDIVAFRDVITNCGALAKAEDYMRDYVVRSEKALEVLPFNDAISDILKSLSDYLTKRTV